jgi:hypothetical protein
MQQHQQHQQQQRMFEMNDDHRETSTLFRRTSSPRVIDSVSVTSASSARSVAFPQQMHQLLMAQGLLPVQPPVKQGQFAVNGNRVFIAIPQQVRFDAVSVF